MGASASTHRLRDFDWQEPSGIRLASSAWGHDGARPRISVGGLKDRIAESGVVVPHQSRVSWLLALSIAFVLNVDPFSLASLSFLL